MAQFLSVHPTHPQKRLIRIAAEAVKQGGLIAYPTDSCYALGCDLGATAALERLRRIRGVDERHRLTLMCRDLSEISAYAIVDDARFRLQHEEEWPYMYEYLDAWPALTVMLDDLGCTQVAMHKGAFFFYWTGRRAV